MNKNLKLFTFFTLIYYFSLGIQLSAIAETSSGSKNSDSKEIVKDLETDGQEILDELKSTDDEIVEGLSSDAERTIEELRVDIKQVIRDKLPKFDRQTVNQIAKKVGLSALLNDVFGFLDSIKGSVDSILETISPDWQTIEEVIGITNTESKEINRQLEDVDNDSYLINYDETEQLQRELISEAIAATTTGERAQATIATSLIEIEGAMERSGDLAQDSARIDVSHQILQNISEQSGINTQLLGAIAVQNTQAQKDRALQINLALQQARHEAIQTTKERREATIANNLGISAWGAVSTPLFLYEEE